MIMNKMNTSDKTLYKHTKIAAYVLAFAVLLASFAFFPNIVSASEEGGSFTLSINYIFETLTVSGEPFDKEEGRPIYMYSPNASVTENEKKLASEKWYPLYGNIIELGEYIPKSATGECVIAVRLAGEIPSDNGTFASRKTIIIKGRPKMTSGDFKNKVTYDASSETVLLSTDLKNSGIDYKVGAGEWILGKATDLKMDSTANYLGGVILIRKSANSATGTFASDSYKLKIPKAASMPKTKVNEKSGKLIGIGKNQAWAMRIDSEYNLMTDSSFDLAELSIKTTNLSSFEIERKTVKGVTEDYYVIYFKTLATEKNPSSPVQKVYIKTSLCG